MLSTCNVFVSTVKSSPNVIADVTSNWYTAHLPAAKSVANVPLVCAIVQIYTVDDSTTTSFSAYTVPEPHEPRGLVACKSCTIVTGKHLLQI